MEELQNVYNASEGNRTRKCWMSIMFVFLICFVLFVFFTLTFEANANSLTEHLLCQQLSTQNFLCNGTQLNFNTGHK